MPRSAPSPPWSSRLCFPVDQLGRLFGSDALPQERRPWRRRRRLSLSIHTGRYTSFPLWTSGKNGTQMRIFPTFMNLKIILLLLPGCIAAGWGVAPPPPPLHGVPRLSVRGVSPLFVRALSGQSVGQTVNGFIVIQDGADVLLKQGRKPQTHAVNLQTRTKMVKKSQRKKEKM